MKFFGYFMIIFGVVIILFPKILAYLIGGFFLFIGLNMILFSFNFDKIIKTKNNYKEESFIKVGKYKIFK